MKLYIRYMVCQRCVYFAREAFSAAGIRIKAIQLGSVDVVQALTAEQMAHVDTLLNASGLELITDAKSILVERMKTILVKLIHYSEELPPVNISTYLSDSLLHDYNYLSNLFTRETGTTIQQFIIKHKIERIKHYIFEDDASLKEIAARMHYSSIGHLSSQFKKCVGITPSEYKKQEESLLLPLENI